MFNDNLRFKFLQNKVSRAWKNVLLLVLYLKKRMSRINSFFTHEMWKKVKIEYRLKKKNKIGGLTWSDFKTY